MKWFIDLLFIPPVHEVWNSKIPNTNSVLKFSWVKPSDLCRLILSNKSIVSQLLLEKKYKDDNSDELRYTEHLQCSAERKNRLLGTLQLEFGFDDFSIVNQLGVKNKNHTYMGLYLTFPHIPLKMRLKQKNIFMVMLVNRKDMRENGYQLADIFRPVITDLKSAMTEGISIDNKNFIISISAICGDNKGTYELLGIVIHILLLINILTQVLIILGYNTVFQTGSFICRECGAKGAKDELGACKEKINFQSICYSQALANDQQIKKTKDKKYGLEKFCIFTELPNVHISQLAPLDW